MFFGGLPKKISLLPKVLCWLVEPVAIVIQSMSSSALTDLLQELQGSEGQLPRVLQNKVPASLERKRPSLKQHAFIVFVLTLLVQKEVPPHCILLYSHQRFLCFSFYYFPQHILLPLVWCDTALPNFEWRRENAELGSQLSTNGW